MSERGDVAEPLVHGDDFEDPVIEAAIKLLESRGIVAGRAAGDGRGGRTPAHGGRPGGAQGGVGGAEHVAAACTVRRVRTAHTPGGVLESPAGTTTSTRLRRCVCSLTLTLTLTLTAASRALQTNPSAY